MISNLLVSYSIGGINFTLHVDTSPDSNLPYVLSELFARIIKDSDVNSELLIEDLKNMIEYD